MIKTMTVAERSENIHDAISEAENEMSTWLMEMGLRREQIISTHTNLSQIRDEEGYQEQVMTTFAITVVYETL